MAAQRWVTATRHLESAERPHLARLFACGGGRGTRRGMIGFTRTALVPTEGGVLTLIGSGDGERFFALELTKRGYGVGAWGEVVGGV